MGVGLETLFHLVYEFFHWGISWIFPRMVMLRADEGGVLIRGGYVRDIGPGFVWHWAHWSQVWTTVVARRVVEMVDQALTTEDGYTVRAGGVVVYRITNPRVWIVDNEDPEHGLLVEAQRVLMDHVRTHTFEEIQALVELDESDAEDDPMTARAQRDMEAAFGVRIERLGLTAFAEARVMDMNHTGSAVNVEINR